MAQTSCSSIHLVGNVARITATFVPDSGTVDENDVEFKLRAPDGTETVLTPHYESAVNVFIYDYEIPEDARRGKYWVRVESVSPSPVIAFEGSFDVKGSKFASP